MKGTCLSQDRAPFRVAHSLPFLSKSFVSINMEAIELVVFFFEVSVIIRPKAPFPFWFTIFLRFSS